MPEGDPAAMELGPALNAGMSDKFADLPCFVVCQLCLRVTAEDAIEVGGADEMISEPDCPLAKQYTSKSGRSSPNKQNKPRENWR